MSNHTATIASTPSSSERASGNGRDNTHAGGLDQAAPAVVLDGELRSVSFRATVTDPDVYATLDEVNEPDRAEFAVRAFKIGVLALRDARSVAKADYIDKEFQRMRGEFDRKLDDMFGEEGLVNRRIQDVFGEDGQVDAKLHAFFGEDGRFRRIMEEFLGEDGKLERAVGEAVGEDGAFRRNLDAFFGENGRLRAEMERVFGEDGGRLFALLNPADETTPLGQFRKSLEERLDPEREGSLLWSLKQDVRDHFLEIKEHLGITAAVATERERGTQKGFDFEDLVTAVVDQIASPFGDRVEHVGRDKGPLGDVGDVLSQVATADTAGLERKIVFEVKDRELSLSGKSSIYKELDEAMENRDADFGVAVVESEHAKRFAAFRYAAPNHILVALDKQGEEVLPLQVAYQVARTLVVSRAAQREPALDVARVQALLDRIRSQLETVRAMKTNLTKAKGSIGEVEQLLDRAKSSILDAIRDLERVISAEESAPGGFQAA